MHEGDEDTERVDDDADLELSIRMMETADDLEAAAMVLQQIWGTTVPIVNLELLRAIAHAGGYVAGAYERTRDHTRPVGASVGFLGRHDGELCLHSHITGILAGVRSSGLGRMMKQHQREWCAANEIPWITWTFDPLVRRNAWFNLEVLDAEVAEYLVNFYGSMSDAVNVGDESDRLLAAWRVQEGTPTEVPPQDWDEVHVATPDNIVGLRRTDPVEADRWRQRVRVELGDRMRAGARVTGFTRDGDYIVRVPPRV